MNKWTGTIGWTSTVGDGIVAAEVEAVGDDTLLLATGEGVGVADALADNTVDVLVLLDGGTDTATAARRA